jgi:hypothetical protein
MANRFKKENTKVLINDESIKSAESYEEALRGVTKGVVTNEGAMTKAKETWT